MALYGKLSKVIQSIIASLVKHRILDPESSFIRSTCLDNAPKEKHLVCNSDPDIGSLERLLEDVSKSIKDGVRNLYSTADLCSINSLLSYDSYSRLKERPKELFKLITALCRIPEQELTNETRWTFFVSRIFELIYSLFIGFTEILHWV